MRFEGQAAMELEFALDGIETDEIMTRCRWSPVMRCRLILDWAPMIEAILSDVQSGVPIGKISAKFHNALAEAVVEVAKPIRASSAWC